MLGRYVVALLLFGACVLGANIRKLAKANEDSDDEPCWKVIQDQCMNGCPVGYCGEGTSSFFASREEALAKCAELPDCTGVTKKAKGYKLGAGTYGPAKPGTSEVVYLKVDCKKPVCWEEHPNKCLNGNPEGYADFFDDLQTAMEKCAELPDCTGVTKKAKGYKLGSGSEGDSKPSDGHIVYKRVCCGKKNKCWKIKEKKCLGGCPTDTCDFFTCLATAQKKCIDLGDECTGITQKPKGYKLGTATNPGEGKDTERVYMKEDCCWKEVPDSCLNGCPEGFCDFYSCKEQAQRVCVQLGEKCLGVTKKKLGYKLGAATEGPSTGETVWKKIPCCEK